MRSMKECRREFGSFVSSNGDWAEIEPGSLRYVTRRTNVCRTSGAEESERRPRKIRRGRYIKSAGTRSAGKCRPGSVGVRAKSPRKRRRGRYTGKFKEKADGAGEGFGFD